MWEWRNPTLKLQIGLEIAFKVRLIKLYSANKSLATIWRFNMLMFYGNKLTNRIRFIIIKIMFSNQSYSFVISRFNTNSKLTSLQNLLIFVLIYVEKEKYIFYRKYISCWLYAYSDFICYLIRLAWFWHKTTRMSHTIRCLIRQAR